MGRRLLRASTQFLRVENTIAAQRPLGISAWFKLFDATTSHGIVYNGRKESNNGQWLILDARGDLAGDKIRTYAVQTGGGAQSNAVSAIAYTPNVWQHGFAYFPTTGSDAIYLDGGNKGTIAVAHSPVDMNRMTIGRYDDVTPAADADMDVAEVAMWNIAFADPDAAAAQLAGGALASDVNGGAQVYWRLLAGDGNIDYAGTNHLTAFGAPGDAPDHPPVGSAPSPAALFYVLNQD